MAQWKQETILKLINAYRSKKFLWDSTAEEFTDRNKRIDAWKDIANEVGFDVITIERKLKSLKTHLMAVHKNHLKRRMKAGSNTENVVKPKWFAYEALSFLIKGRAARDKSQSMRVEKQTESVPTPWKPQVYPQEVSSLRDEFSVFAEHVAIRLKNIGDVRTRLIVQHQINNILFEAEMGKYNNVQSMNSVSTEEISKFIDD